MNPVVIGHTLSNFGALGAFKCGPLQYIQGIVWCNWSYAIRPVVFSDVRLSLDGFGWVQFCLDGPGWVWCGPIGYGSVW